MRRLTLPVLDDLLHAHDGVGRLNIQRDGPAL